MGKERIVILENNRKQAPKVADFNCCIQLSVNVEATYRAVLSGLCRKNHVKKPNSLAGGWKTIRATNPRQRTAALTTTKGYIRHG
jgi:hypothetical protein